MSQGVVIWMGEDTVEELPLFSMLAFVLIVMFLLGSLFGVWISKWGLEKLKPHLPPSLPGSG